MCGGQRQLRNHVNFVKTSKVAFSHWMDKGRERICKIIFIWIMLYLCSGFTSLVFIFKWLQVLFSMPLCTSLCPSFPSAADKYLKLDMIQKMSVQLTTVPFQHHLENCQRALTCIWLWIIKWRNKNRTLRYCKGPVNDVLPRSHSWHVRNRSLVTALCCRIQMPELPLGGR